jgi:hypothetical protein
LGESVFVKNVLDAVRTECRRADGDQRSERDIADRLDAAQTAVAEREQQFLHGLASLDADERVAIGLLDERLRDQVDGLEDEWQSERKQSLYNKPSPELLGMRKTAKRMLGTHRFDEAMALAARIEEREAEESRAASRRMADDYAAALANLTAHFEIEKAAVKEHFRERRSVLDRNWEKQLAPMKRRIANVMSQKPAASGGRQKTAAVKLKVKQRAMNLGMERLILRPIAGKKH